MLASAISEATGATAGFVEDHKTAAVLGGIGAVAAVAYFASRSARSYKKKPSSFEIGGGDVDAGKIKETVRGRDRKSVV